MAIRKSVEELVRLGPLPGSQAPKTTLGNYHEHLERIEIPVTDEEAALLVNCFGPDECHGLAWSLIRLIESAPGGIPITSKPRPRDNEWVRRLWSRSHPEDPA